MVSSVHWEVTLKRLGPLGPLSCRMCLLIGFAEEKRIQRHGLCLEKELCFTDYFALYLFDHINTRTFCKYLTIGGIKSGKQSFDRRDRDAILHFHEGDRVELRFDFQRQCCNVYYNAYGV